MPIILNRFSPGVLTDAQLNALVDAITAKFNGQITEDDMSFPFRVGGNIDMVQFELLHLYKLWNVRNLAERSSSTTLQNVLDEVATAGGGVVLLPADTTETVGTGGVTIGANTMILGQGDTSLFTVSGAASNHTFRNVTAAGDAGITMMGFKLVGATSSSAGSPCCISMSRTSRFRMTDVWVQNSIFSGVQLITNSTGNACTDTKLTRVQIDSSASAVSGLLMTDVTDVDVSDCKFNVTANNAVAIQYTANGATSRCDRIAIGDGTTFNHLSGTGQESIVVAAGATTGIDQLSVLGCNFRAASGQNTNDFFIDIDGGSSALVSQVKINDNVMKGGQVDDAAIRLRNLGRFSVCDNEIDLISASTALGILIGATARAGTAASCINYKVCDNNVVCGQTCYVFCHPGSGTIGAVIDSNFGSSTVTVTNAEFEIWNLGGAATTLRFVAAITNNVVDGGSGSIKSWQNYTDRGSTPGGRAGNAANSDLTVIGNHMVGTVFGDAGGADDFRTTPVDTRYVQNLRLF